MNRPARTRWMSPRQYVRAIAFAWWAADEDSDDEALLTEALRVAGERYGIDITEVIEAVSDDHGPIQVELPFAAEVPS